ncbi:unnamed protein product, partial [Allacma fusca]
MKNEHLRTTIIVVDPFILFKDQIPVGGCYYNILLESSILYNFTYDMEYPKFKGMVQLKNGTWIGQAGQVIRGEKDVILGSAQTFARYKYFDFPTILDVSGIKFITALPHKTLDWAAVLYIFQPLTWICLSLCCFGIFTLVYASELFFYHSNQTNGKNITAILGITLNPLIEHGATVSTFSLVRVICTFWILGCIVIVTFFKSDFVAYITYPKHEEVPRTFFDLSQRPEYNIKLLQMNAAATTFFNTTTSPVYSKLRQRMTLEKDWLQCIYASAFEPKTVCINFDFYGVSTIAQNLTWHRSFSNVQFSTDYAVEFQWSMGFTKNSKFLGTFNEVARFVRDTGLFRKWKEDFYESMRQDGIGWLKQTKGRVYERILNSLADQLNLEVVSFILKNVLVAFIILTVGLSIAKLVFLWELG